MLIKEVVHFCKMYTNRFRHFSQFTDAPLD